MSDAPGSNELRYRRKLVWQHLWRLEPLYALAAAYRAWDFHRFLKARRAQR